MKTKKLLIIPFSTIYEKKELRDLSFNSFPSTRLFSDPRMRIPPSSLYSHYCYVFTLLYVACNASLGIGYSSLIVRSGRLVGVPPRKLSWGKPVNLYNRASSHQFSLSRILYKKLKRPTISVKLRIDSIAIFYSVHQIINGN